MATVVGGVSCDIVNAIANSLKTTLDLWRVPGLHGYGAQDFAGGDSPFTIQAIKFDTSANVETWFAALEALQGSSISVTTGPGSAQTYTSLLAVQVRRASRKAVIQAGTAKVRGEVQITGVKTA